MKNTPIIVTSTKLLLSFQRVVSYFLLLLVLYPIFFPILYLIYRYRIIELKSIRKEFKEICSKVEGPLLICSNHLTYIDPVILLWAFGSYRYYLFNYKRFVWNFPNSRYSQKNGFNKLFFFISKCIPIHRNAYNKKIKETWSKMIYLLLRKETLLIFPEGKRSSTGRIDDRNCTKGTGRLLSQIPNLPVLCVYLKGESNNNRSFPEKGEKFHIRFKLIYPETHETHENDAKTIEHYSSQIIHALCSLEEKFLAAGRN